MNIKGRVKIIFQAYKKVHNKKGIVKKIFKIFIQSGLAGLKYTIFDISRREVNSEDIYDYQQKTMPLADRADGSVTVIIEVQNNKVDITGTITSLKNQTLKNIDIKLIVPKEYSGYDEFEKVDYLNFPGEAYRDIIDRINTDYFVVINGSNILHTSALMLLLKATDNKKEVLTYCDECIFDGVNGKRIKYFIKPDYSEVYQTTSLYIEQGVMFPTSIAKNIENFMGNNLKFASRIQYAVFNTLEFCNRVNHVRHILLLRNSFAEDSDLLQNISVIQQNLNQKNLKGTVCYKESNRYVLSLNKDRLKVSIVIACQDAGKLKTCISSILTVTDYPLYEIIVVSQKRIDVEFLHYPNLKILTEDSLEQFNYSKLCNKGAQAASGEIILFVKETVKIVQSDWLKEIISCFAFDSIGAVSPKILREDNTIQYSGIISGGFGFFPIPFNGDMNVKQEGINDYAFVNREISILSSTCLAVRKEVFEKIEGFNQIETPNKFSNADLSLRIQRYSSSCFFCADSIIYSCDDNWYDSWFENDDGSAYLYVLRNYIDKLEYDPYFTNEMKYCYLKNIPYEYSFHCGKNQRKGRAILLVSHELTLSGAPIALQYAAKTILEYGDYPVVVSPFDGNLRSELTADGVDVIIDPTINGSTFWLKWAKNFDLIIVSTLVQYHSINQLNNMDIPVVWWVHESQESYTRGADILIPKEIGKNIHVYCGGGYAKKVLKEYRPTYNVDELLYCVPDYCTEIKNNYSYKLENIEGKMVFTTIGSIEKRKGQDIFVKAILSMPEDYIKKCRFFIIGRNFDENIYREIENLKNLYPEQVTLINEVSRKELWDVYNQSHAVVCASRDDPMPVFMTETLMLSKIAICSENTGTASILDDGVNGFVYKDNSYEKLKEKMMYVIDNYNKLGSIKYNGRKVYEQYFTEEAFNKEIRKIINKFLNEV